MRCILGGMETRKILRAVGDWNQASDKSLLSRILGTSKIAEILWDRSDKDLWRLATWGPEELMQVRGLGENRVSRLLAVWELARRLSRARVEQSDNLLRSSGEAAQFLQEQIAHLDHEVFCVLYLNRALRLIRMERISQGGITGTLADPRIIFRKALSLRAVSLILGHNHPSGSLQPSMADRELTRKVQQAASYLEIAVHDHLIVSKEGYYSFADEGIL